ncbi:MAG: hypothetical protein LAT64_04335 [Phycisphaerales bacterium]|nr:hypothetical protein [Planctomycetota bacterium]MCH8507981.1 hypothetical protein [Phycisphaerales bacterium]
MHPRAALAIAAIAAAGTAHAGPITFQAFENANAISLDGLNFTVDLVDHGSLVDLVWRNNSTAPAHLVNLYVEATDFSVAALSNPVLIGGDFVAYAPGSAPPNPPGSIGSWSGNLFSAAPLTPRPNHNAVNPGESLTMRFDLHADFNDLTLAMADPQTMRLAAHVRGVGPDQESSIWIVSTAAIPVVPAPGAIGVLILAGLGAARRQR